MKDSDTSNEPSSTSATATDVEKVVATRRQKRKAEQQSAGLPSLPAAAAAAAPTIPRVEKKPISAGSVEHYFLQRVRIIRSAAQDASASNLSTDSSDI